MDLNQRPPGYEPDELPDCSTPRQQKNYTRCQRECQGAEAMESGDALLPRADRLEAQVQRDLMALVVESVQDDQSGAGIGRQAGKCFDQVGLGGNFLAADFLQNRVG